MMCFKAYFDCLSLKIYPENSRVFRWQYLYHNVMIKNKQALFGAYFVVERSTIYRSKH